MKGRERELSLLFCLVYFASYITRINYGAVIPEVVRDLGITNAQAGLAVTGSFITYGAGQPLMGWLGDRLPPKPLLTAGLLGTALCNLAAAAQSGVIAITVLWSVNGFFQSMLWPPLIRMIADAMPQEAYRRTCVNVVSAANGGTILIYLSAPLLIRWGSWRLCLVAPAAAALAVAVLWQVRVRAGREAVGVRRDGGEEGDRSLSTGRLVLLSGVPFILGATMLQGLLRDGITTWMPTYISEAFSLGTGLSILSAVVLPLFAIVALRLTAKLLGACGGNEMTVSLLLFAAAAGGCLVLCLCSGSVPLTAAMMALVCGSGHGVNQMLISNASVRYAPYGRVSTMTGILNACTYVGSALSAYGFAAVADRWGWQRLILLWLLCSVLGGLLCWCNQKRWKKFIA